MSCLCTCMYVYPTSTLFSIRKKEVHREKEGIWVWEEVWWKCTKHFGFYSINSCLIVHIECWLPLKDCFTECVTVFCWCRWQLATKTCIQRISNSIVWNVFVWVLASMSVLCVCSFFNFRQAFCFHKWFWNSECDRMCSKIEHNSCNGNNQKCSNGKLNILPNSKWQSFVRSIFHSFLFLYHAPRIYRCSMFQCFYLNEILCCHF